MSSQTVIVPEWLTKQYLEKILANYFGSSSLHLQDFTISPGSNVGDNYICQIFRVQLHYTRDNQKETRNIIAKLLIKTDFTDGMSKNVDFFGIEVKVFKHTLPLLYEELKKTSDINERFYPDIIHIDEINRVIFMEDLKENGYQSADRKTSLDLPHSLLVIKSLASMHASSYILFKRDQNHKNMYMSYYWENVSDAIVNISEGCKRCLLKALPKWHLSDEVKERLGKVNCIELSRKWYKKRDDSFNVLLHGDCWMSNMMFKRNNEKVESVKLLDFQIVNYNSIGLDLNHFIFSSTMEYVKLNHINDLLSQYYDTFIKITGEIEGFSLKTVQKEFHERLGFGLMVQLNLRPAMIYPDGFDIDGLAKKEESLRNDQIYLYEPYVNETIKILPLFLKYGVF